MLPPAQRRRGGLAAAAAPLPVLVGVLGWPVSHSRSPAMHNAAFRELGLDWRYLKLPVPPERLVEIVRALSRSGYRGANVTIPHKLAALEAADTATPAATAIGAANTLAFEDEAVTADNTDARGLLDALPAPVRDSRALVLGAGGAGRAAVWALREEGAEVSVWNRTAERAAALAADLGVRHAARPEPTDLLVNATTVGLAPGTAENDALEALALTGIEPPPAVVDLVYGDRPTALCVWAEKVGAQVVDGLDVLVRQGALSLERWTGERAPLEAMHRAARDGQGG